MKREREDTYAVVTLNNHPLFPGRTCAEKHRVIMAEMLGRQLLPDEHVHHKNEWKRDNRRENLALMSEAAHHALHHPLGEKRPKVSETLRKHWADPAARARQSEVCKEAVKHRILSEAGREALRVSGAKAGKLQKGKPKSPETRKRMSDAAKARGFSKHFTQGSEK